MITVIILTLLLISDATTEVPNRFLHMSIANNCSIMFLPNNSASPDVYSLEDKDWYRVHEKCHKMWKSQLPEQTTVSLITAGDFSRAVDFVEKTPSNAKQHLKIVVLLGYDSIGIVNISKFCSMLEGNALRVLCFNYVYERVAHYNELLEVKVLALWFHMMTSIHQATFDMVLYFSVNAIISKITYEIQNRGWISTPDCTLFSKFGKETKQFFLSSIVSNYDKKGYSWRGFAIFVYYNLGNVRCYACNEMFLNFKNRSKLDSIDALILLDTVQRLQDIPETQQDYGLCQKVETELNAYLPTYASEFLQLFDEKRYEELRGKYLVSAIVPEVVRARSKNVSELIQFLWEGTFNLDDACPGSLALLKIMNSSGELYSIEAFSLFLHYNKHTTDIASDDTGYIAKTCFKIRAMAPDLLTHFMFSPCKCCKVQTAHCNSVLIHALLPLLQQDNFIDKIKIYPREILFVGFLVSLSKNGKDDFKQFATYEQAFNESLNLVFEAMVLTFFENAGLSRRSKNENELIADMQIDVNELESWYNMEMYHYYLNLVIKEATKRGESHFTVVNSHVRGFKDNFSIVCKSMHVIFIQGIVSHADRDKFSKLYTFLRNYCEKELLNNNPNIPSAFHTIFFPRGWSNPIFLSHSDTR